MNCRNFAAALAALLVTLSAVSAKAQLTPEPPGGLPASESPMLLVTPPPGAEPLVQQETLPPQDTQMEVFQVPPPAVSDNPVEQCKEENMFSFMVRRCLRHIQEEAQAELDQIQLESLHNAKADNQSWRERQTQAQALASSAMSFDAFSDTECKRQLAKNKAEDKEDAYYNYQACQIRMIRMRIDMLRM